MVTLAYFPVLLSIAFAAAVGIFFTLRAIKLI